MPTFRLRNLDTKILGTLPAEAADGAEFDISEKVSVRAVKRPARPHQHGIVVDPPYYRQWHEKALRNQAAIQNAETRHLWIEIRDCLLIGEYGLLIDPAEAVCWVGESTRAVEGNIPLAMPPSCAGKFELDATSLTIETGAFDALMRASRTIGAANMLVGPGVNVYGHALLDFAPRAFRIARDEQRRRLPVITTGRPAIQAIFARAGIHRRQFVSTASEGVLRVQQLHLHDRVRSQNFDHGLFEQTFATIKEEAGATPAAPWRQIYVSRSRLKHGRRVFRNVEAIEAMFGEAGWECIHPEELAFEEQVRIFAEARAVAGDDGSGLHNTVFSPAGTKVICMDHDRRNMGHVRIADLMRQKILFLDPEVGDDGYYMPLERIRGALSKMGL